MERPLSGSLRFVTRGLPTALVLGLLAAVGYWGHKTGWKAPKWAELVGEKAAVTEDWCIAHNVPNSRCIVCHPELAGESAADWCTEHGVPESKCVQCHPEILTSGKAADWCVEHGVPESGCTLCHPEIAVMSELAVNSDRTVTTEAGAEPAKNPTTCQTHLLRVQFASKEAVDKAGIKLALVQERAMPAVISVPGEVRYVQPATARCSSKVVGALWRVEKLQGDTVKQGDILALVDSIEVGRAKVELLAALAALDTKEMTLKRIQTSASEGFRMQTEVLEADSSFKEARVRVFAAQQTFINLGVPVRNEDFAGLADEALAARVRGLGVPESLLESLKDDPRAANLTAVLSPIDGTVIEVNTTRGDVIDSEKTLFVVVDVSRMWVVLAVNPEEVSRLKLGQKVEFAPDGAPDEPVSGEISWIATAMDEVTRTVEVRAEVSNQEGRLRAGAFGRGRVLVRATEKGTAVPETAVNWEGCCFVTFVRLTDEIFQTRKVNLGSRSSGYREVLAGLSPGEAVVTEGSHVLKSDILRNQLGAG